MEGRDSASPTLNADINEWMMISVVDRWVKSCEPVEWICFVPEGSAPLMLPPSQRCDPRQQDTT